MTVQLDNLFDYDYSIDGFDVMIESGWADNIRKYTEGEKLISFMKKWRYQWLSEKTSGNTGN